MCIDPVSSIGVAANLHVLAEFFVADRPPFGQQLLHLPEYY